jgi:hypothetical protein
MRVDKDLQALTAAACLRETRGPLQAIEFTARDAQIWSIEMGLQ